MTTIPPITVLSRPEAEAHTPVQGEVAISISSPSPEALPVLQPGYEAVLALRFADTTVRGDVNCINAAQADSIVAFALAYRDARALMIHCGAGISRSHGVAAGLEEGLELAAPARPTANRAVAEAVRDAVRSWFSQSELGTAQTPGDALKAGLLDNLVYGERLVAEAHQAGLLTDEERDEKLSAHRAHHGALLKGVPVA